MGFAGSNELLQAIAGAVRKAFDEAAKNQCGLAGEDRVDCAPVGVIEFR